MIPVIGLTGMPGSGKSVAMAKLTGSFGAGVDTDRIAHEILEQPGVVSRLEAAFGKEILVQGRVDRKALAKKAFRSPEATERLNGITHPAIRLKTEETLNKPLSNEIYQVLEVPLLFEAGFQDLCDLTVFIDAPFALRAERVRSSRAWSEEELKSRDLAHDEGLKRRMADLTVDGAVPVEAFWEKIRDLQLALRDILLKGTSRSRFATSVVRFLRDDRSWVVKSSE